jgi:hypothetical protein
MSRKKTKRKQGNIVSDNLDSLLIETIAAYEREAGDGSLVDFAHQLATARLLGQCCKTETDLAHVHALMDHSLAHMRRLGSLAFCFLPHCWYEQTLPLVQQNLSDPFKWIRYDSIRFFFFHACLDDSVFELLDQQQNITTDPDITKAINTALTALTELRNHYAAPFKTIQVDDFLIDIPEFWELAKDNHIHVFTSPLLGSLYLNEEKFMSSLRLWFARGLTADDIKEMPIFNMEAKVEDANIILPPAYVSTSGYRATYHPTSTLRYIPEFTTTEFRAWDESSLLVANLMSPLVHQQWAQERNIKILDSIRRA